MSSTREGTIFALSSGALPAAIAIVRISGPAAAFVLTTLRGSLPPARRLTHARLHGADGALLDQALAAWFPGPNTVTGEDLAELHLHGGRAVVKAVLQAIGGFPDCRPALPGEFTRRAFANGRIDLAEAEGLADLLAAETHRQREQALRLAEGGLGRMIERWRRQLLALSAAIEAEIEFAEDEDDAPVFAAAQHEARRALLKEIGRALHTPPAERLRDGVRVVLAGPVNAGKSSLLNGLVGREAAIATEFAGTTRDLVEVPVQRDGIPLLLIDSAGLRSTDDAVERIGIERARHAIEQADIVLWLGPAEERPAGTVVEVFSQADRRTDCPPAGSIATSTVSGIGIDALWTEIVRIASRLLPSDSSVALNARHRDCLNDVVAALAGTPSDPLLLAEDIRSALSALDRVTGRAGVEDMLDTLFGQFCIGK